MINLDILDLVEELSREDLKELNTFIIKRFKDLNSISRQNRKGKFKIGDLVSFRTKKGAIMKGEVAKINRVNINVEVMRGYPTKKLIRWSVNPSFLTKIEV